MEKTWRWFGRKDRITVDMLCQIGVEGIVTALHDVPNGDVWTREKIRDLTNPDGTYTQRGQDVIRQTPFGRMGEPEELCGTIHYLMSDASKFVTGTVAVVDGGFNVFAM